MAKLQHVQTDTLFHSFVTALLGQQAQEAVDIAMDADGSAQRAQDIADDVMAKLRGLEDKAAQLPVDVAEANKAFDVADNASKFVFFFSLCF